MGRFKTDKIFYKKKSWKTPDLILEAYRLLPDNISEVRKIAQLLQKTAHDDGDEELFDISSNIVKASFISRQNQNDETELSAADDNNRPNPDESGIREKLKNYFTYRFLKDENAGFETLMGILNGKHSQKYFAIVAYQIYISKYFLNSGFNTFSKWYYTFCDIVGCEYVKSYKPSKLKPDSKHEAAFLFLQLS